MTSLDQRRRQRAANGSRRQRDLAAAGYRRQEEGRRQAVEERERKRKEREDRLRPSVVEVPTATAGWASVLTAAREHLGENTFRLWLEPLRCLGEVDGALFVVAPVNIAGWTERRYGHFLGGLVRDLTDYRGLFCGREVESESDGVL